MTETLYYIANIRIPTEKGHGLQIVKMCEALAHCGIDVRLVVPKRRNLINQSVEDFYGIQKSFALEYIPVLDTIGFIRRWGFVAESIQFAAMISRWLAKHNYTGNLISRDPYIFWYLMLKKYPGKMFYEVHTHNMPKNNRKYRSLLQHCYFIATNEVLANVLLSYGIAKDRVCVLPNGYDETLYFPSADPKSSLKGTIGAREDRSLAIYTGHLYDWKGIDTLVNALRLLPSVDLMIVGGSAQDVETWKKKIDAMGIHNITFVGYKPYREVPRYIRAADVAVLPLSGKSDYSRLYTSPIKLFGYYACGIPVVASDVPALAGVADDRRCILTAADDEADLARGIQSAISAAGSHGRVDEALRFVKELTWTNRAKKLLQFMNGQIHANEL